MLEIKQPTTRPDIYDFFGQQWYWEFPAGALADRFGRRFTLILGLVCAATARIALDIICAISITGFYALHLHAQKRLSEKQRNDIANK